MLNYIEKYRKRFGCYPREVLADQIYCTRVNRTALKELGIKLLAKPLGRPSALSIHVSLRERNPIEGKFGQAKTGYGLNRIKARLRGTSESWIATIILVLNLVKLAGVALLYPILNFCRSFSARLLKNVFPTSNEIFKTNIFYKPNRRGSSNNISKCRLSLSADQVRRNISCELRCTRACSAKYAVDINAFVVETFFYRPLS